MNLDSCGMQHSFLQRSAPRDDPNEGLTTATTAAYGISDAGQIVGLTVTLIRKWMTLGAASAKRERRWKQPRKRCIRPKSTE